MRKCIAFIGMFIIMGMAVFAQQKITGTVTTGDTNEPLPGVNVVVKGTTVGTTTDVNGSYQITTTAEDAVLVFSFVGYLTEELPVAGQNTIDVTLEADMMGLDEVVVVGFGTQKKSVITGAIAKIDAESIAQGKNLRVEQALQGKAAGVMVMNNSGQPGDNLSIRIRGVGTNENNDPLVLVDGFPMDLSGLDFLSPSDIESIEVLKDAASAAIYGTRAANGVVLVTTKKGHQSDKVNISYSGYYGVSNPWRKLDMLETDDYIDIINEAAINAGQSPKFSQAMIDTLRWNTDWQDEMFYKNAPKQSHSLIFSGGSETSTYSSSLNYMKQDGIVAEGKSKFERISYRLNTTKDFGKRIQIGSNITYTNINTKGVGTNDQYDGTSLIQAINTPPIVPVTYDDGSYATPSDFGIGMQEITNPIAMLDYTNKKTRTNKIIGVLYGEAKLFKGLSFRTSFGTEYTYVNMNSFSPEYYLDPTHLNSTSSVTKDVDRYNHWNFDNYLSYEKSIANHNIHALLGTTAFKETSEGINGTRGGFIFDDLDYAYPDNALSTDATLEGGYTEHTLLSYFGRINYNYNEKYLFEGVLRADGSSRFGSNNRFGYFPSVSAGWIVTKEEFMPQNNYLTFLKIRGSWGKNGNERINDFKYTSLISTNNIYYFGATPVQYNGTSPSNYSNPDLKWEASEQFDLGIDFGFFYNKLTFTVDYYNKKTVDWLVVAPIRPIAGNDAPQKNAGDVRNRGVEMELGYKETLGDLRFNVNFNGSYNKNEVLALGNNDKAIQSGTGGHGQADILRAEIGSPLGYFYALKTDGIFQNWNEVNAYKNSDGGLIQPNAQPGDFRFVDASGNGAIGDEDRVNLGNPYPDFNLGLNFDLQYKGFDLNMFWYAGLGHQIYNATRRYDVNYTNYTTEVFNRWTGEGTSNSYPRVTLNDINNNWKTPSDFFVEDADFLRLKTLTVGYSLPKNLLSSVKVAGLRIYVTGENLLTFTKYPGLEFEVGGGPFAIGIDHGIYPQARTILAGVNLDF